MRVEKKADYLTLYVVADAHVRRVFVGAVMAIHAS